MLFHYLSSLIGLLKLFCYKLFYYNRINIQKGVFCCSSTKVLTKKGAKIIFGRNTHIRNNCLFRAEQGAVISIQDNCFFNDNCIIVAKGKIEIGSNTIFGPNVQIFDHDHRYTDDMNDYVCKDIQIGENCWIGANCILLKGIVIGNNSVVAAGTIVTKSIPDNSIVRNERKILIYEKH